MHTRDALVVTDMLRDDGGGPHILYVNEAFERLTGYKGAEVIGRSPGFLQGAETNVHSRARIRNALANRHPIEIEMLNYRKDGSPFWVELTIVPIRDESGEYKYWLSFQRDVTSRRTIDGESARMREAEERAAALALEVERRRATELKLAHAVSHDALTGLRNRAYFGERLRAAFDEVSRTAPFRAPAAFAVLFLDLDRFKVVNDSLGHSYGDALLREVAGRLAEVMRATDTLARIGGDEFVILLDGGQDEAVRVAERIVAVLAKPIAIDDHQVVASPSIGIAVWHRDHLTPETLMRDADTAMYRAKEAGGNRFMVFTQPMHDRAIATLQLQSDIRLALERHEFRLAYQPIVDVNNGAVHGFEALIRWEHPTRGLVYPGEFIPFAEEYDLISRIGSWALRRACATAIAWRGRCDRPFTIGVNVSTNELVRADYIATLRELLENCALPAESLMLEITESVFLLGEEIARPIIAEIRALGVKVAFDDFGTGFSSLNYLDRFEIDVLKIDRSFVSGVAEPTSKRQIVRTIVALADALHIDVVAEGVEQSVQREALIEMGASKMQGYLFAPPMPEEEALGHLLRRG